MIYFLIFHSGMGSLSLNLSQVADQKAWWKQFPLFVHSAEFIEYPFGVRIISNCCVWHKFNL